MNATELLARRSKYVDGWRLDTRTHWDEQIKQELRILAEADVSIERVADLLGRSPSSIAWRCKTDKIRLPKAWAAIIRPASKPRKIWVPLAYPYVNLRRTENETLLLVNEMVAHALPGREDVCQDIMLAILERGLTPNREVVNEFIRKFRKQNYENSGYALSLDAMLYDTDRTLADTLVGESSFDYWNAL